jgi:hypothetical protein
VKRRNTHRYVPEFLKPATRAAGRFARNWQWRVMNIVSRESAAPIFLLGNQKSGTTAIAGLLARMTGLSATLDVGREVKNPTFHRIPSGQVTFDQYVRRNRWAFANELIKEPNLTLFHPQLRERFPRARYVFILRDPRDNIRSLLNTLDLPGDLEHLDPASYGPSNPRSNPGWPLVFDSRWYGVGGDQYIEHLAERWRVMCDVYLKNRDDMTLCRYEDFDKDKVGTLESICRSLDLPAVNDIRTELDQQFQPRGDRSRSWAEFFGEANLATIERVCVDGMRACGYAANDVS